jgi:hypothetical protein
MRDANATSAPFTTLPPPNLPSSILTLYLKRSLKSFFGFCNQKYNPFMQ